MRGEAHHQPALGPHESFKRIVFGGSFHAYLAMSQQGSDGLVESSVLVQKAREPECIQSRKCYPRIRGVGLRALAHPDPIASPASVFVLYLQKVIECSFEPAIPGVAEHAENSGGTRGVARVAGRLRGRLESAVLSPRTQDTDFKPSGDQATASINSSLKRGRHCGAFQG